MTNIINYLCINVFLLYIFLVHVYMNIYIFPEANARVIYIAVSIIVR